MSKCQKASFRLLAMVYYTLERLVELGIMGVTFGGVLWLIISSLVTCCTSKPTTPEPTSINLIKDPECPALPAAVPLVAATEASRAQVKPRMYFLDNIKAFLTFVVICHHVIDNFRGTQDTGAAFSTLDPSKLSSPPPTVYAVFAAVILTLNQSYFMALFFFISGYFTPSSLDRKGLEGFLRDRFKRIGIPAVVYTIIMGPFQIWLVMALGKNDDPALSYLNNTYHYEIYPGQCWYLHWLVFLSFIYAFVHREPLNMPCPKVSHIFLLAFGSGTWFVLQPEKFQGNCAAVPGGFRQLFCYVLYFAAGIVAKRNDWMAEIVKSQSKSRGGTSYFLCGLIVFLVIAVSFYQYSTSDFLSKSDVQEAEQSSDVFNFSLGFFAVLICLAELQFFHTYFNQGGRVSKFFCEGAYGAYIVHFLFVNLGTDIYFRAMRQFSGLPKEMFGFWQPEQYTIYWVWSGTDGVTVGQQYTWFGMIFVCAFATLCSWSAAFFLRKLPLFNQVL